METSPLRFKMKQQFSYYANHPMCLCSLEVQPFKIPQKGIAFAFMLQRFSFQKIIPYVYCINRERGILLTERIIKSQLNSNTTQAIFPGNKFPQLFLSAYHMPVKWASDTLCSFLCKCFIFPLKSRGSTELNTTTSAQGSPGLALQSPH